MKEYKYSINGNEYTVAVIDLDGNTAAVEPPLLLGTGVVGLGFIGSLFDFFPQELAPNTNATTSDKLKNFLFIF